MFKTYYIGTIEHLESNSFVLLLDPKTQETCFVDFEAEHLPFELEPQMHVVVETNGIVALSYPPRVFAQHLMKYDALIHFTARVLESTETLLVEDTQASSPYFGQKICVHLTPDQQTQPYEVGSDVRILFNGMMTRSLPPQIQAIECTILETT